MLTNPPQISQSKLTLQSSLIKLHALLLRSPVLTLAFLKYFLCAQSKLHKTQSINIKHSLKNYEVKIYKPSIQVIIARTQEALHGTCFDLNLLPFALEGSTDFTDTLSAFHRVVTTEV